MIDRVNLSIICNAKFKNLQLSRGGGDGED